MLATKYDEKGCSMIFEDYMAGNGEIYFSFLSEIIVVMTDEERKNQIVPQDVVCISKMMKGDSEEITGESLYRYCEDFRANMIRKWYSKEWKRI